MGQGIKADAGPGQGKEGLWAPGWSQMSGHKGEPRARGQGSKQEPLLPSMEHAPILWVHRGGRGELCPRPGVQGAWKDMWAGLGALGRHGDSLG